MTRRPAAPANLRNGLKWRDGRPRWEPSPANRACGFSGMDLKDADGAWLDRGGAMTAADNRTRWAAVVREAMRDTDAGGVARGHLRRALELLPPVADDREARHRRQLVADLIERGRAVLEDREPRVTAALAYGPRTVQAMVDGFFADPRAMARIKPSTREAYATQGKRLAARFGTERVDEVTRPQLRNWYLDLVAEVSIATANQAIGAAAAFFTWATWQDPAWLTANPCTKLGLMSAPGRRVFWTVEEEHAFIDWCDANGFADVADCIVTCLWTGARQIDVCSAALHDLEGKSWRYVPEKTERRLQEALPGLLAPVTRRVERRRGEAEGAAVRHLNAVPFLWSPRAGRRHDSASIGERFRHARAEAVKAGALSAAFLQKQLRDTRDTCVTRLWAAGVPLDRILVWGGWSHEGAGRILREHYLVLLEEGALEAAAQLETWGRANGVDMTAVA